VDHCVGDVFQDFGAASRPNSHERPGADPPGDTGYDSVNHSHDSPIWDI
jgi:hypothetical protein